MRQQLEETYHELMFADGYDDAIVGVANRCGTYVVVYNYEKVIEILSQDMDREDAVEFFDFNVAGANMGEMTPVFML